MFSHSIKSISVVYNPINQNNIFTNGDFISGQVILEVTKETQMQSLSVKIKGKASVMWTERHHHGKHSNTVVYSDKEKYYSVERFFVRDDKTHANDPQMLKDPSGRPYPSVVAQGRHVYPFTFQLPQQNFPPTFKSTVGKILYTLEAKLSRSMRLSSKHKAEFHYVPRPDMTNPQFMAPQHATKDKHMKLFTSGDVSMNINTEKMGYYLGEGLKVLADIQNNSSRSVKLKYCLYEKHSFFARGKRKLHTLDLTKEEGEAIESHGKKTVTKVLSIPPNITPSILNCRILKVEYRLRVYLDIPYATDPEVKFPIVFLLPVSGPSSATNSDFGTWNQPPGANAHPIPPPMAPLAPPPNVVGPPGQFGAPGHPGAPVGQFGAPGHPGAPVGQFGAPGNTGAPVGQFGAPGHPGAPVGQFGAPGNTGAPVGQFGAPGNTGAPVGQFGAPGYPGPPVGQFGAPGNTGPPVGQFGAPGYPGAPVGQFGAPGYPGPPMGHFGSPGNTGAPGQSDSSAPPPYKENQLYPNVQKPEKS